MFRQFVTKVQGAFPAILMLGITAETQQSFSFRFQPLKASSRGSEQSVQPQVGVSQHLCSSLKDAALCAPSPAEPVCLAICLCCHLLPWAVQHTQPMSFLTAAGRLLSSARAAFLWRSRARWRCADLACLHSCLALAAFKCDLPAVWEPCSHVEVLHRQGDPCFFLLAYILF